MLTLEPMLEKIQASRPVIKPDKNVRHKSGPCALFVNSEAIPSNPMSVRDIRSAHTYRQTVLIVDDQPTVLAIQRPC